MRSNGSGNGRDNRKWVTLGAAIAALLTKYKTIVPVLTKLLGPMLTMLASVFAYAWATRSWMVGIGFVAMLFVHEMGHVLAAKQKGLPVSAPLFIPFVGALIAMKQSPRDAATEAYVAIGGPVVGTLGALLTLLAGLVLSSTPLVLVAYMGFFVNLINLLPIRPLDGGRIASAVTRWLWLVGLIGGLVFIVYMRSLLFLVVYVLFVIDLYQKYVAKRGDRARRIPFVIRIPATYLRTRNAFVPGEEHRRKLDFVTYSNLDRTQHVEVIWDALAVREKVALPEPILLEEVRVMGIKHVQDEQGDVVRYDANCEMFGIPHTNERYYDVPASSRWVFGAAYLGLAMLLIALMLFVQRMYLPGITG